MTIDELVLNTTTRKFLDAYVQQPNQSVLVCGPKGCGLFTIAHALAEGITTEPSAIMTVQPDEKGTISIERVRSLYVETRSIRTEHFVIIIDDIEKMSHDAQNSFLKLLEEPVDNVYFIVTAHEPQQLLATILSRVQSIEVTNISATASESLLRKHHVTQATALQQMLFIAPGLPAELSRLADDKDYFEHKAQFVRLARDFLTAPIHERLERISQISGREDALLFVTTIAAVLQFKSDRDSKAAGKVPADVLETVATRLANNGHVRTQLMFLAVNVV